MPETTSSNKQWGRLAAVLFGLLLLAHLARRVGPTRIVEGIAAVGWGVILVIGLAGVSHVVRTWGWRLTLLDERNQVSFRRMLALRLTSEAAGQVGVFGQVFGDTWRVAGLGAELPIASRVSSVALDRALFTLTSALVTISGVVSVLFLLPLSHKTALFAEVFVFTLAGLIALAVVAVRRRWALLAGPARAIGRIKFARRWVDSRLSTILSVENRLLDFFHHARGAFWASFALNLAGHVTAVLEVFLILRLMGERTGFLAALAIEGLTKLVNVIGIFNPGNIGTYEGGNMLLARMLGIGGAAGLTLGLIRRLRALFWAAVGVLCLVKLPRSVPREKSAQDPEDKPAGDVPTAIILANGLPVDSLLARVGELPVLLRAILGAQKAGAARIVVTVDEASGLRIREELARTRRLPETVEWRPPIAGEIGPILRNVAGYDERIVLIAGDRTYHPSLHRRVSDWGGHSALSLTTEGLPVGICALNGTRDCPPGTRTIAGLHEWLVSIHAVECEPVPGNQWQRVVTPEDRLQAETKLDEWLVKPTDGVFARTNRKVSIPISRQLIKLPVTPNMVSLFTLGVSFLAGAFFALGGRQNMSFGAVLSVFASILDGCDGEVARLTFQESAFGCWLETICDYLYYVFIFAGMMIGVLGRGPVYLVWGTLLFFGAVASFVTTAMQRHKLAGARPEQYLRIWQGQASKRRSNPFLYLGRHTEFLIRRCCMPYLFLGFALFGGTHLAFIGAAVGANVVWPITLYSYFQFDPVRTRS